MKIWKKWNEIKKKWSKNETIDPKIFNQYLAPTFAYTSDDNHNVILFCRNKLAVSIINAMKKKIISYLEDDQNLMVSLFDQLPKTQQAKIQYEQTHHQYQSQEPSRSASNQKSKPESLSALENNFGSEYSLENFYQGPSNMEAFQAVKMCTTQITQAAANKFSNPLLITSDPGLGKTHLLKGSYLWLKQHAPEKKVLFIEADHFCEQFLKCIKQAKKDHEKIFAFKQKLKSYDVFMMDDFQTLANRKKTNDLLFQIINFFIDHNKQFILTADVHPKKMKNFFTLRLLSRITKGLCVTINPPLQATAIKIINRILKQSKTTFKFAPEVIIYIANNYMKDIREMQGVVNRMLFLTMIHNFQDKMINLEDVKNLLEIIPANTKSSKTSLEQIKQQVADFYQIAPNLISSKQRHLPVAKARQVAIYLALEYSKESTKKISHFFKRDHSTLIYHHKVVEKTMQKNKVFKKSIQKIKKSLT